jgi:sarcosine oxidase subunit gamma
MVEAYLRQSPLAHLGLAARAALDAAKGDTGVIMTEHVDRGQIVVRGNATDPAFRDAVAAVVGATPPDEPNTVAGPADLTKGPRVLWLGPDEWLVVTAPGQGAAITDALRDARAAQIASVADISDARAVIGLSGPKARAVAMKGCTLDLHPRVFGPDQCAQTLLARAGVILHQTTFEKANGAAAYDVYVLRSFAEYLWAWLEDAAQEYGCKIV